MPQDETNPYSLTMISRMNLVILAILMKGGVTLLVSYTTNKMRWRVQEAVEGAKKFASTFLQDICFWSGRNWGEKSD